jgi:transposase
VPGVAAGAITPKKKALHDSARDTPRVRQLRAQSLDRVVTLVLERVKVIDETGSHRGLTRLFGRAAPGQRVGEAVPRQAGTHLTLLAALGVSGVSAPWVVEGVVDGGVFAIYLRDVLGPTLMPGDVVVMDNLSVHKVAAVDATLTTYGARLEYLPPYSPDFNPIEQCWAKIKTALRTAKARTLKALFQALQTALLTISEADAQAWFAHCGYPVH